MDQNTYALVTGASSGIGRAMALQLAAKGHNLVLVARTEKALQQLATEIQDKHQVKAEVFVADLTDSGAPEKIKAFCVSNSLPVSILINNAGYAVFGLFESLGVDKQLDMMQVNNNAIVRLCHAFIPMLKKQPKAYIMNIASTSAYQAVPGMSLYAASKAFVITFTRGLQMELGKSNIHVCCMVPGPTATNFMDRADMGALKEMAAKFEWPADKVAAIALKGMFGGAVEVIPGMMNRISYVFTKLMPKKIAENIAAGIYLKPLQKQ